MPVHDSNWMLEPGTVVLRALTKEVAHGLFAAIDWV